MVDLCPTVPVFRLPGFLSDWTYLGFPGGGDWVVTQLVSGSKCCLGLLSHMCIQPSYLCVLVFTVVTGSSDVDVGLVDSTTSAWLSSCCTSRSSSRSLGLSSVSGCFTCIRGYLLLLRHHSSWRRVSWARALGLFLRWLVLGGSGGGPWGCQGPPPALGLQGGGRWG